MHADDWHTDWCSGDPESGEETLKGLGMWVVSKDATTLVTDKMLDGTDAEYAAARVGVRIVREWVPAGRRRPVRMHVPSFRFFGTERQDIAEWQARVQAEIEKWKKEPGYIEVVPIPLPTESNDDDQTHSNSGRAT